METDTYERALQLWPDWRKSIAKSRRRLRFRASWSVRKIHSWLDENYPLVRQQGISELERMELPPNLQQYWEDCFYCDYWDRRGQLHLEKITRNKADRYIPRPGQPRPRSLVRRKSRPPLPFEQGLVWEDGEDTSSPWLRVEIMIDARFATHHLFKEAAEAAYKSLWSHLYLSRINSHPVAALIVRAKAAHAQRRESAVSRLLGRTASLEDLIHEEWETEGTQGELMDLFARMSLQPSTLQSEVKKLQNKVYNRVRRWIPAPVPKVASRRTWRDRLQIPTELLHRDP